MAYLLICVRTEDTIFDRAVFSKDLAPVKFDTSEMGLAFRHDPCTNSAQYFVIHSVTKPPNLPRNQSVTGNAGRDIAFKDHDKKGTSLPESKTSPECTCSKDGSFESACEACNSKLLPKLSLVLLDTHYKIVTKLKSDIAYMSFKEVARSKEFREGFINFVRKKNKLKDVRHKVCTCENVYNACSLSITLPRLLEVHIEPAPAEICLSWNEKLGDLVKKRMILEETMAWLSTLGGGYSSLGDYFKHFSEEAGRISVSQLQIAMEMGDPVMAAKCRLFYALSLMQRGQLHQTKKFIRDQYYFATHFKVLDQRLIDMCKGMWSKLQYLHAKKHKEKLATATSKTQKLTTTSVKDSLHNPGFELEELEETPNHTFQGHSVKLFAATGDVLTSNGQKLAITSKDHLDNTETFRSYEEEDS